MRRDPAAIIQAAIEAGVGIDAPVVKIEEGEVIGTYVLILYNGKRLEWAYPQDSRAGGDVSPPTKSPVGRLAKNDK